MIYNYRAKLIVQRFFEPDIKEVEADIYADVLFFKLARSQAPLAEIQADGNAVVLTEDGDCHTQGDTHRIYVFSVHRIIGLVIICTQPVCAAP